MLIDSEDVVLSFVNTYNVPCCKQGHAMTLLLNEAYTTLMDVSLRGIYNEAHSHKAAMRAAGHTTFTGSPFSQWIGPDRPQGIFVDENVCIGEF